MLTGNQHIELEWIEGYFRTIAGDDEDQDELVDPVAVKHWLAGAQRPAPGTVPVDDPATLRARLTRRA